MKKFVIISFVVAGLILVFFTIRFLSAFSIDTDCDGHGKANGHVIANGYDGMVKDCSWQGIVTYTYSDGSVDVCNYEKGLKHGKDVYTDSLKRVFKNEIYNQGKIESFVITDYSDSFTFNYKENLVSAANDTQTIRLSSQLDLSGNDEPFVLLNNNKLILRGRKDLYVINKRLEIELNLRDTLLKYLPSAYNERIDESGNRFDFLWHRCIIGDTLNVEVFYDGDESQSNQKNWKNKYLLSE